MKKTISIICGILILLCLEKTNTLATHASGSDLTYRWISGNQYELTVNFYRNCEGVQAPSTVTINVRSVSSGQNFNITLNQISNTGQEITFPCNPTSTSCNGGVNPGIQQYTYRDSVTLPLQCVDWVFSYSICCRHCSISTITNQVNCNNSATGNAMYVEALLNNIAGNQNSSPTFTNVPVSFIFWNQPAVFNHGAVDIDGDSLVYSFIAPKRSATVDVGFLAGFSSASWLTSNPAVTINSVTGDLSMTPTLLGEVAVCAVLVQEYRNGILIGSVIRDMNFWVKECGTNFLPSASGMDGTANFSAVISEGTPFCFVINSNDQNNNQQITMNSNALLSIPGSAFTVVNQGGISPDFPMGTFCWTPLVGDARSQPYTFTVTVFDDNCDYNTFQTYSFSIVVIDSAQSNLNVSSISSPTICNGQSNGFIDLISAGGTMPYSFQWNNGETNEDISGITAGVYSVTVTDASGNTSDNSVTIAEYPPVTVLISTSDSITFCTGTLLNLSVNAFESYLWNNAETTSSIMVNAGGTYSVTVTDANNCTGSNSEIIIENSPTTNTIQQSACDSFSLNSQTFYTSGIYFQTLINSDGCDSTIILNLNISVATVSIVQLNDTLHSSTFASAYQWYLNGTAINGATAQSYTPDQNGNYTLEIIDVNGCIGLSNSIEIINVGFDIDLHNELFFVMNSNPCTKCEILGNAISSDLVVSDLVGRIIVVDLSKIYNGYAINFLNDTKGFFFIMNKKTAKVLKFVRE